MRGRMLGVVVVGTASMLLLASCLVGSNKNAEKRHTITSARLHLYESGDSISMQYVAFLVNSSPQSPTSNITMRWDLSSLAEPFTGNPRSPLLRFTFQDAIGSAVQYVKQDGSGSIFLHGFGGFGATIPIQQQNSFWPDVDGVLSETPSPEPMQVFWSPIEGSVGSTLGINYAMTTNMNFKVMGDCNNSNCTSVADFTFAEHEMKSTGKEVITTPLGKFETYHLHYNGTMNARAMQNLPPNFDYRISCWTPGSIGTVTFEGDAWIYPLVGPVQIENDCKSFTNGTYQTIKYRAQITATNLPF